MGADGSMRSLGTTKARNSFGTGTPAMIHTYLGRLTRALRFYCTLHKTWWWDWHRWSCFRARWSVTQQQGLIPKVKASTSIRLLDSTTSRHSRFSSIEKYLSEVLARYTAQMEYKNSSSPVEFMQTPHDGFWLFLDPRNGLRAGRLTWGVASWETCPFLDPDPDLDLDLDHPRYWAAIVLMFWWSIEIGSPIARVGERRGWWNG